MEQEVVATGDLGRGPVGDTLRGRFAGTPLGSVPLLSVPLFVQNEADVAAVGELEFGGHPVDVATLKAFESSGVYLGVLLQNLASAYDPGASLSGARGTIPL